MTTKRALIVILAAGLMLAACTSPTATTTATVPSMASPEPQITQPVAEPTQPALTSTETAPATTETPAVAEPPAVTEPPRNSVTVLPDPAAMQWQEWITGLKKPLDLDALPGSGLFLVTEQNGTIRLIRDGKLEGVVLDVSGKIRTKGSEQGLLGLAISPDFAQSSRVYIDYTDTEGKTVVARYLWDEAGQVIRADSEEVLLTIDQPFANHNGGSLEFGPDGYLYIGTGDGGSGGDPMGNAQNMDSLLGKMLRLDVSPETGYAIPADNPFANDGGKAEIWATGLRNPWRYTFDPANGDFYIADVGQNLWEEVNYLPAGEGSGANFGWKVMEGSHPFQGEFSGAVTPVNPVYEYGHDRGCSVTGGVVYRGFILELYGVYLFADYCKGWVSGLVRDESGAWTSAEMWQLPGVTVSAFGQDHEGEAYLLGHNNGVIYKLVKK
ncbi:MAG TPA: PQQ-dependent sugar dehydrogenase [Bellilinea sp.]|nr:PQQ-dependent sugar dehydrogenase [Bellilinea sp.]